VLTNTLVAARAADAVIEWMLERLGNEQVRSINPLVGETNDGVLNDIRARRVGRDEVFAAIESARDGVVAEGSVGAGTGTIAFGFKGGIGTASRVFHGATIGVLVQTNFGGVLTVAGAPVGVELGRYYLQDHVDRGDADGSIMIVIATDAPIDHRNLMRLAARGMMGLGRTGASGSNGSGDYVIAFSTARPELKLLANDAMSPLFQAAIEATEEAICNSLFQATTIVGRDGNRGEAIPIEDVVRILRRRGVISG
jgi:D-aminopeptidase